MPMKSTHAVPLMSALCALTLLSCAKNPPVIDASGERKYAMPRDARDAPSKYTLYTYGIDLHQLVRLANLFEPDTNIVLLPTRSKPRVSQVFGGESASEMVKDFSRGFSCRAYRDVRLCLEQGQPFPDGSPSPLGWSKDPIAIDMNLVRVPMEALIKLFAEVTGSELIAGQGSDQVAISIVTKGATARAALEGILWLSRATITEQGNALTISYEEGSEALGTTPDRPLSAYKECGVAFDRFSHFVCPDLESIHLAASAITPATEQETRLASRAVLHCGAEIPGFLQKGEVISVGAACDYNEREPLRIEQIEPDSITLRTLDGKTTHTIFTEDDL